MSQPLASEPANILLVTGASRGIGAAVARLAGPRGYAVAVNYRQSREEALAVVEQIQGAGARAEAFQADVGDPEQVARLFAEIDGRLGPITALVNNAGYSGGRTRVSELTPERLESIVRTTLYGAIYCTQQAIARMARSQGGRGGAIVNIGSEAGRFGGDRLAAYGAAKAGLHTLTLGLARELAGEGIRVNAVSPGLIDTESNRVPGQAGPTPASLPFGRLGRPEEVAEAVLWLLSDAAGYVSGAVLPVAGAR
jgi:NAD(P)-dependent dehydrogenase (short-subunit alcohol dehydrogenase family)